MGGGAVVAAARRARDTVVRRHAHEPLGWRPTTLRVIVRRYRCSSCLHVWRQDTSRAAEPRAKLSRRGLLSAAVGLGGVVVQLIESISHGVPAALSAVVTLGRTLKKRADDVLVYFDRPAPSNGRTEAINGRLEHLRGSGRGDGALFAFSLRRRCDAGPYSSPAEPGSG